MMMQNKISKCLWLLAAFFLGAISIGQFSLTHMKNMMTGSNNLLMSCEVRTIHEKRIAFVKSLLEKQRSEKPGRTDLGIIMEIYTQNGVPVDEVKRRSKGRVLISFEENRPYQYCTGYGILPLYMPAYNVVLVGQDFSVIDIR